MEFNTVDQARFVASKMAPFSAGKDFGSEGSERICWILLIPLMPQKVAEWGTAKFTVSSFWTVQMWKFPGDTLIATISYWAFKSTNNHIATIQGWCNTIDVDANCLSLSIVRHEDLLCQNLTACLAVKPFWLRSKVANADTRSQPHFGEESLCWWCASYDKHHVCRVQMARKNVAWDLAYTNKQLTL